MRCTALRLTTLVLRVMAAIPGACENKSDGNNDAEDDVTLMQVHMKVASAHDTKMPAQIEHVPTDADRNNQNKLRVPSNVTRATSNATPEEFTEAEMNAEFQKVELAWSVARTSGICMGCVLIPLVLIPVVFLILVIVKSPSEMASKQKIEMHWYHYMIFVSISMVGPMATDILLPAFPEITLSLGTTEYLTSLTMPVNMGLRSVSLVLIGLLSDELGQKKMMMISLVLFVGGSIICTTATDIQTLFIGRILQAMGEGSDALVQAVVRMLIDDPHDRIQVLSVLTCLQPVFVIIAPLIGAILTYFFGWRSIFGFLVCCAMGSLMGYALIVPETRDDKPQQPVLQQFEAVFGNQEAMFLLVPFALIFSVLLSMLCNMAFILNTFGESTIGKGLLMASLPPFEAVGATVTSKVFVSEDKSLFVALRSAMSVECLVLATMFFLGMIFVHSEWLIMASFWSITFGMGLCVPTLATLFLEPFKDTCGLASGILVGAQNLPAALLVPFSVGELQKYGVRSMYLVFIVIHLIAQAVFWVGFGINREKWLREDDQKASGAATLLQSNAAES